MKKKIDDLNLTSYTFHDNEVTMRTDIYALDYILGGGIIKGNLIQLLSESGLGKTTICLQVARNLCSYDYKVLYIDVEGSVIKQKIIDMDLNKYYNKNFFYIRKATFKDVEQELDKFINNLKLDLIIIDSIACLINESFVEDSDSKSITTNNSNYNSRPLSLFFNKYNAIAKRDNIAFLFTNQYRNSISLKTGTVTKAYGGKNTTYNSDIILKLDNKKNNLKFKDFYSMENTELGDKGELSIIKSNVKPPGINAPYYLYYGRGISNAYNIAHVYLLLNIITCQNRYYELKSQKFHGFKELISAICDNYQNCYSDFKYDFLVEEYNKRQKLDSYIYDIETDSKLSDIIAGGKPIDRRNVRIDDDDDEDAGPLTIEPIK